MHHRVKPIKVIRYTDAGPLLFLIFISLVVLFDYNIHSTYNKIFCQLEGIYKVNVLSLKLFIWHMEREAHHTLFVVGDRGFW